LLRGLHVDTFIYPRNRIGHTALLSAFGFLAWRPPSPWYEGHGLAAELKRYGMEFNPFERLQQHSEATAPLALPAGRMLLVRAGNRAWVPTAVMAGKLDAMVARAVRTDQVVHLFTHPHNFLVGRDRYDVLEALLRAVSRHARAGEITVRTQREYAAWRINSAPRAALPDAGPAVLA